MANTTPKFDERIAEIKVGNERRDFDEPTLQELGQAAITRLAIASAVESAS